MRIMGKIGFRYIEDFERPPLQLIQAYQALMQENGCITGNVGDCLGRVTAMSPDIRGIASGMKILGPAVTVKVPPGDNLMIHKALTLAKRGDVLVIDGGGFTSIALLGFIIAQTAKKVGISGFVVDGSIRDVSGIKGTGLGVFARGISPNGPTKEGPGEINFPISCGGKIVHPGDIIIGDEDGVIVIPKDSAAQALSDSKDLIAREASRLKDIEQGIIVRPGLEETLHRKGLG